MGFVRVSGYNEEDLNNARQQGADDAITNIGPKYLGVNIDAHNGKKGSDTWTIKYFPSETTYSDSPAIVSWEYLWGKGGEESNVASVKIQAITPNMSEYADIISKSTWGDENVERNKEDGTFAGFALYCGKTVLPAGARVKVQAKAQQKVDNTICFASGNAWIYSVGLGSGSDQSDYDNWTPAELVITVAEGKELFGLFDNSAQIQQMINTMAAEDYYLTLVDFAQGVATFTLEYTDITELQAVIAKARELGYTLSTNNVTGWTPYNPYIGEFEGSNYTQG